MKITFFDFVEAHGVSGAAEKLQLDKATVSRVNRGLDAITERHHQACVAVMGADYDAGGTVLRSLELRHKDRSATEVCDAAQP